MKKLLFIPITAILLVFVSCGEPWTIKKEFSVECTINGYRYMGYNKSKLYGYLNPDVQATYSKNNNTNMYECVIFATLEAKKKGSAFLGFWASDKEKIEINKKYYLTGNNNPHGWYYNSASLKIPDEDKLNNNNVIRAADGYIIFEEIDLGDKNSTYSPIEGMVKGRFEFLFIEDEDSDNPKRQKYFVEKGSFKLRMDVDRGLVNI